MSDETEITVASKWFDDRSPEIHMMVSGQRVTLTPQAGALLAAALQCEVAYCWGDRKIGEGGVPAKVERA